MTPKKKQLSDEKSTILLDKEVIGLLQDAREYPRQTYNELIKKIVELFISAKRNIVEEREKESEKENYSIKEFMEKSLSNGNGSQL
jgi:hypothetical protein